MTGDTTGDTTGAGAGDGSHGITRRGFLVGGAAGLVAGAALPLGVERLLGGAADLETFAAGDQLTILSGRDETDGGQRRLLVDLWNRVHEAHPARIVEVSSNADRAYSTVLSAAQAGDPAFDVYNLDIPWVPQLARGGYLRALDGASGDGFLDGPWQAGTWDGTVYALPFNSDVGLLYCNLDLVAEYYGGDVPAADPIPLDGGWAGLDAFAHEVLAAVGGERRGLDRPPADLAIALQLADYEGCTVNLWEILLGADALTLDETGRPTFDRVDAIRDTVDALAGRLRPDGAGGGASLSFDEQGALAAFAAGRAVFLRHWPRALRVLRGADSVPFRVGFMPMPGGGVLGGQSLAVAAASRYPVAARRLVEFLTDERSHQMIFERGGFAASREAPYRDPAAPWAREADTEGLAASLVDYATGKGAQGTNDPLRKANDALRLALDGAAPRPRLQHYVGLSEEFRRYVRAALAPGGTDRPGTRGFDAAGLAERMAAALDGRVPPG
ncbi:extracellular solute-binding protein [Promicromonospora thailandica]|uniref:Multiple sugar transport system substrate-binding protein n=1 Tax=Promicromonospora thailandica TaxID=765201 RepID=A0A9X2G3Y8_9MICO|nr:extracellular solute-binding protein [Promicromonospora thailandica]MCP2266650.1 multiple sugar transport system substrate-binding protein [Promicromonospora thailandica]BFF17270.1 ABC transporter substrate-binding protein [Promicromonospora thailandica]